MCEGRRRGEGRSTGVQYFGVCKASSRLCLAYTRAAAALQGSIINAGAFFFPPGRVSDTRDSINNAKRIAGRGVEGRRGRAGGSVSTAEPHSCKAEGHFALGQFVTGLSVHKKWKTGAFSAAGP